MPNSDPTPPPASIALSALDIPHRVFTHTGPVHSLAQAAEERNQYIEQVIRSILFRLAEGEYAMALIAGPRQISWKSLRRHFNQSRLSMAKPEEVLEVTGYEVGAVSPFGLPTALPMLVDQSVLDQQSVSIGSGVRATTIFIKTPDLLRALGAYQSGDFGAV